MSDNPRHDGANFDAPHDEAHGMGMLAGDDLTKSGAEVSGSAWAFGASDLGCSEGPSYDSAYEGSDGKVEGQIDVAMTVAARQDIPYEHDFHVNADISFAPERVDVPDPKPESGVPALWHGEQGQPLPFDQVAPERGPHGNLAPDGRSAPEASDVSAAAPGVPS
jgi:hypothetical protein